MSRSASFLIATLLLFSGYEARAQQSNAGSVDAPAAIPTATNPPASPASVQPVPPPAPDPAASTDSLIPPSQGAPTPGPESLQRTPASPARTKDSTGLSAGTKAPSVAPVSKSELEVMAVKPPPSDSPFFVERQEARDAAAQAGREGYGMYVPKPPKPPAQQQIKKFFQGFFGHGKKGGVAAGTTPMILKVEPSDFSLAQTSELDVSLTISNAKKQEIEILFPDNQRLEILTKDSSGNVLSRWSEDRVFDPQEGFTELNPNESVIYAEHITTSKMKAGQTYTIEASLANQEGFTTSVTVSPKP